MAKKYVFRFEGTKDMFLDQFNWSNGYFDDMAKYKHINDYILKLIGTEIHFGVERGGHSGGYWYVPTIIEFDDHIEFEGKISQYNKCIYAYTRSYDNGSVCKLNCNCKFRW